MPNAPFDATKEVTFDLAQGRVAVNGTSDGAVSRVLVPAAGLAKICELGGEPVTAALGGVLGEAMGHRLHGRLGEGDALRAQPLEAVVDHLGGELALAGLGTLAAERWGRALVFTIVHAPFGSEGDRLLGSVLERALSVVSGRDLRCVPLGRGEGHARFLVAGPGGAEKVTAWLASGVSWHDALARLHGLANGGAS